ncbi:MAG: hypothetical protein EOP88_03125 [Verrucomicrobiaceae bacterium]|nr:MAG: hypothetical protein EOP88_03125 [Verrucomicrobiaceae bacterium]
MLLLLAGVSAVSADGTGPFSAQIELPGADIWMYQHGGDGGTRTSASTFTALPSPATSTHAEDRFAQFVLRFDTASLIHKEYGADNYLPEKVVMTAVLLQGGLVYDPTEDARQTYLPSGAAGAVADTDAGRPIELFGTGFRSGATEATFNEESEYGSGAIHGRSAYAMSYSSTGVARDVSHNVTEGIDSTPWAVGRVLVRAGDGETYEELAPGAIIPELAHVEFELNLTIPGVAAYVRQALDKGRIWFTVSSLHSTTEMASSGYPSFYTKENAEQAEFGDVAAFLQVDYSLPVRVISFSRDAVAGTAAISWNGSKGFKYELQRSEELTGESWLPVTTITPNANGAVSWSGASASPRAFYRVLRTPAPPTP